MKSYSFLPKYFLHARETAQKIMKSFKPEFVSMCARGRRIPHTHLFLVPTNKGESFDRHFNALEGFQDVEINIDLG